MKTVLILALGLAALVYGINWIRRNLPGCEVTGRKERKAMLRRFKP